jgi:hypothetical protein
LSSTISTRNGDPMAYAPGKVPGALGNCWAAPAAVHLCAIV